MYITRNTINLVDDTRCTILKYAAWYVEKVVFAIVLVVIVNKSILRTCLAYHRSPSARWFLCVP
jgi:hypothetical protein